MAGRVPPVAAFALVALAPAVLLIWGAASGGWPLWLGFLWMAAVSPAADTIIARGFGDAGAAAHFPDPNSAVEGRGVDVGGRGIIKKKMASAMVGR